MSHPRRLLFVGERRSATAIRMGVTWGDGRVCAGTLHAALATVGIDARDPERVWFMNLWRDQPFEDCQWSNMPHPAYSHGSACWPRELPARVAWELDLVLIDKEA
jgi:hypothetical protein